MVRPGVFVATVAGLSIALQGCGAPTTPTPTIATTTTATTTETPTSKCGKPMLGVECLGVALDNGTLTAVKSIEECCDLCVANKDCGAYTHVAKTQVCTLKRACVNIVYQGTYEATTMSSSLPLALPPPLPPSCPVPDLGKDYRCYGDEVGNQTAQTQEDCCQACLSENECLIFNYDQANKVCHFLKNCPIKPFHSGWTTGWTPPPNRNNKAVEKFRVGRGVYDLEGYECRDAAGSNQTAIFYPIKESAVDGPFRVVVYGHGAWGYVDGSDDWLEAVAGTGLIVIAPFQGKDVKSCKTKFADDLLNALAGSRAGGAALHPALGDADWTKTGIMGHSKGAKYSPLAAHKGQETHNVSAMIASCDTPADLYNNSVPSMFTTGTLDKYDIDGEMKKYFLKVDAKQKVYTNLMDAYHMEVQEGMRLNVLTAQFLACHVSDDTSACDVIYGNGDDSICKVNDYWECCVGDACPVLPNGTDPEPLCLDPMDGVDCQDEDADLRAQSGIADSRECCGLCGEDPTCGAWTFDSYACYLKKSCVNQTKLANRTSAMINPKYMKRTLSSKVSARASPAMIEVV